MTGRLPDDAIRTVRERASLTEVVSDVVTLRRRGRSALGLCPFHAEKTPSFNVSEERGFFHCFGCGEHGDVFTFVMKVESLTFPEAVRRVAGRFGITLPEPSPEAGRRREPITAANAAAATFFRAQLAAPSGARARAYLRERGLTDETIERFGLGYAPGTGDALVRHLRTAGCTGDDTVTAGLAFRRETRDALVDRFRDRVMFPIHDGTGKVIAFGGRILPGGPASGDPPPKYLNSAESPVFRKGHTLYGLFQAREAIRRGDRAVVVEGYLDVIALAQAGIGAVVAPLGTALTVDQLRLLRRFTESVIACFDGDEAGRRAAARSFPTFLEAGLWGRGAFLPAREDPDSFVRAHGRDALEALLAAAEPLVEAFVAELAGPSRDAVGRRAEAAREVARLLKRVRNPFEHDVLARLAAERLGVREEALRGEAVTEATAPVQVVAGGDRSRDAEEQLVELMAADPDVAERVRGENVIAEFRHPTWRQTAETLTATAADHTAVVQALPRELRDRVARLALGESEGQDRERAVADCIARIRSARALPRVQQEIGRALERGDMAAVAALQQELRALKGTTPHEEI